MNPLKSEEITINLNFKKSKLYKLGAYCSLSIILIYLIDLIVVVKYGIVINKNVTELFYIFHQNKIIGLLQSFSLDIIAAIIRIPLMIALFVALSNIQKSNLILLLSFILGLIGITVYLSYNSVFSMLHLSDLYFSSTNPIEKQQYVTVGLSYLSSFNANGIQPFFAFTLFGVWGILICMVMFRSSDFGKLISIIGIVGFTLEQGPPMGLYPEIWNKIDPILIGLGGFLIMIWYLLIFIKLIKLAA